MGTKTIGSQRTARYSEDLVLLPGSDPFEAENGRDSNEPSKPAECSIRRASELRVSLSEVRRRRSPPHQTYSDPSISFSSAPATQETSAASLQQSWPRVGASAPTGVGDILLNLGWERGRRCMLIPLGGNIVGVGSWWSGAGVGEPIRRAWSSFGPRAVVTPAVVAT